MNNSINREAEVPLLSFEHTYNQTTGLIDVRKQVTFQAKEEEGVRLIIVSSGLKIGEVEGVISQEDGRSVFGARKS